MDSDNAGSSAFGARGLKCKSPYLCGIRVIPAPDQLHALRLMVVG